MLIFETVTLSDFEKPSPWIISAFNALNKFLHVSIKSVWRLNILYTCTKWPRNGPKMTHFETCLILGMKLDNWPRHQKLHIYLLKKLLSPNFDSILLYQITRLPDWGFWCIYRAQWWILKFSKKKILYRRAIWLDLWPFAYENSIALQILAK